MSQHINDAKVYLDNPAGTTITRVDEEGARKVMRVPATATNDARIRRWVEVVTASGHTMRPSLTNHSADLDINGSFGRMQRETWKKVGHFEKGKCPIALAFNGDMFAQYLSPANRKAYKKNDACPQGTMNEAKPCKHTLEEIEFRQARHLKRAQASRGRWEKHEEKMLKAQQTTNDNMMTMIEQLVGALKDSKK